MTREGGGPLGGSLDLVESGNVHALHQVFQLLDGLGQPVNGDLVIFHHSGNLQLLDTVANGHELGCKRR